ncbi:hypothetical protein L0P88_17755 [Muricauda sp. SCSIO 64092]|uniref:hypothetical protein n=1 Tax=Allomuricauda sp. SCSIO 64092 TaxID=2908842 RepID=UPI001FF138C7|nr:hypothetical protein [Muricauda sp. SCSIO 64092]UOY05773.1 hypothetical protein L0P88_17755 [Muricauda sp. SCSIO 64092]
MKKVYSSVILVFIIFSCICVSCKNHNDDPELKAIKSFMENINMDLTQQWIVILPGLGCQGCIKEAEIFMKENIENDNILFVLTKIESIKTLENKTNLRLKDYSNIYLDIRDELNIPTNNTIYPCVVKIKNGIIEGYEFQSPQNSSAFVKLKHQITTKE